MARRRERPGLVPQLTALARSHIRAGDNPADVVSLVAGEFTGVSLNQIRGIVDREERIWQTTSALLRQNRGQFVNVAVVGGCYNQASRINLRMRLHYTNAQTGQAESFTHSTFVQGIGRWGDMLDQAIADVTAVALERNYQLPTITSGMRAGDTRWEMVAAECIP